MKLRNAPNAGPRASARKMCGLLASGACMHAPLTSATNVATLSYIGIKWTRALSVHIKKRDKEVIV